MSVCKIYHSSSRASLEIIVVLWWRLGCDVACGETGYPQGILTIDNSKIPKRAKSKHKGHLV